jgi:S1-C subfamily serine protease
MQKLIITAILAATGCQQMLSQEAIDATLVVMHQHTDVHGTFATRGTAWIFAKDEQSTWLLTNNHVIDPAPSAWTKVSVDGALPAGTDLYVEAVDRANDLAVLRADVTTDVEPIPLCDGDPGVGDRVMILGYRDVDSIRVESGNVMSVLRYIRMFASAYEGMSGGPVLNETGECAYSSVFRAKRAPSGEVYGSLAPTNDQVRRLVDFYM